MVNLLKCCCRRIKPLSSSESVSVRSDAAKGLIDAFVTTRHAMALGPVSLGYLALLRQRMHAFWTFTHGNIAEDNRFVIALFVVLLRYEASLTIHVASQDTSLQADFNHFPDQSCFRSFYSAFQASSLAMKRL
jgi:hypothetical protein